MDEGLLLKELDNRIVKIVMNFAGKPIDQTFITSVWAATLDEVKNFNDEKMFLSTPAVDYIHSYYINTTIKISTATGKFTIGELTTLEHPVTLEKVTLVELYRMQKMFENTVLENMIGSEIQDRLNNGNSQKQTSRSDKQLSN